MRRRGREGKGSGRGLGRVRKLMNRGVREPHLHVNLGGWGGGQVGDLEKKLRANKMRSMNVVDGAKQGMRRKNDEIVIGWDDAKTDDVKGKAKVKADKTDW